MYPPHVVLYMEHNIVFPVSFTLTTSGPNRAEVTSSHWKWGRILNYESNRTERVIYCLFSHSPGRERLFLSPVTSRQRDWAQEHSTEQPARAEALLSRL